MKITKVLRLPDRLELVAEVRGYVAWPRSTQYDWKHTMPVAGDDIEWGKKQARWTPLRLNGKGKPKTLRIIKVHDMALLALAMGCWTALAQQLPPMPAPATNHVTRPPIVKPPPPKPKNTVTFSFTTTTNFSRHYSCVGVLSAPTPIGPWTWEGSFPNRGQLVSLNFTNQGTRFFKVENQWNP